MLTPFNTADVSAVEITGQGENLQGSAQITVEIQHKAPFLADKGAIEHVLAVEDDVVPFDRADVLYQGGVDAFLCEISRKHRRRDLLSLPVDNASQNQRQATRTSGGI